MWLNVPNLSQTIQCERNADLAPPRQGSCSDSHVIGVEYQYCQNRIVYGCVKPGLLRSPLDTQHSLTWNLEHSNATEAVLPRIVQVRMRERWV